MPRAPRIRPSALSEWPVPFDPAWELDWSRPDYGRRLLREHLDQSHDGASRRLALVDQHVRRLRKLLPSPPATLLDAGSGPGLYATRLAVAGFDVTGIDVNPAAIRHARAEAPKDTRGRLRFHRAELAALEPPPTPYDAAILVYYVLEAFPAREQPRVLRRIAASLGPGGIAIVEMRLRPDQLPGRICWWDIVDSSVLSDRRHLLLGDGTYDRARNTYVLREIAVFDDGTAAGQQTSAWLCPFDRIPSLFRRGGLEVTEVFDGWSSDRGNQLSESVIVVSRRLP
ncbi:MAG: methyltransferase domain-containing protein [Candidatus Dormibacteraeota bacterium]|nr:methyltransferase domain-containing protein [Candidatus Dormibacteraeota bacterium]